MATSTAPATGCNNRLVGNAGTNVLTGGNGDDRYVVQNAGDQVVELANQGIDTVESSVSFTLANHVEQLVLTGNANIDGTGNALDNGLYGNAGINLLRGLGGNDIYVVQNTADQAIELANAGLDTVNEQRDLYARRQCREPHPDRRSQH